MYLIWVALTFCDPVIYCNKPNHCEISGNENSAFLIFCIVVSVKEELFFKMSADSSGIDLVEA